MNDTDPRLWHPWLRINRFLRAMLHGRWSAEAWPQVNTPGLADGASGRRPIL